ncbi:MAG: hypothetical protein EBY07_15180, partial [Actinobacteria bacterium]|nr:hypothetical protein [Actinomycetota bacterium]
MNMKISPRRRNRAFLGLTLVAGLAFNACGGDDTTSESPEAPATTATDATTTEPTSDDPLAALYEECLAEGGQVNLIALPDEWANYKGILAAFGEKYPDV